MHVFLILVIITPFHGGPIDPRRPICCYLQDLTPTVISTVPKRLAAMSQYAHWKSSKSSRAMSRRLIVVSGINGDVNRFQLLVLLLLDIHQIHIVAVVYLTLPN